MELHPSDQRQLMACGYEPPIELGRAWTHRGMKPRYADDPLATVCPGYTTKLPEVAEVAHARLFWAKGELVSFTRGEQPTEDLNNGIVALEVSANEMQDWVLTPASEGGGRD